jgi:hypothetical protein
MYKVIITTIAGVAMMARQDMQSDNHTLSAVAVSPEVVGPPEGWSFSARKDYIDGVFASRLA